ncbi:MAG: M28 family metallopeptidase [Stagnimonas sp.]|nr:M28 family metallopeptidase [Stagnimonas sp.]
MNKFLLAAVTAALSACAASQPQPLPDPPLPPEVEAGKAISAAGLLENIAVLASDEFEGRLPGGAGEAKTVAHLEQQFRRLGLQPGNPDGRYVQEVPLVGISGTPSMSLAVGKSGAPLPMAHGEDFVAVTSRFLPEVSVSNSSLVFVGYGVQAPEYDWDDYKGIDVRGKTLVMLINDPAVRTLGGSGTELDGAMFAGKGMTYYGRWTYKFEIASKLGAAAAIIVHETEPAAYPWDVVRNSWSGEQFELAAPDRNLGRVPVQAWITVDKARALFKAAGRDFDALKRDAAHPNFTPVKLKATASFKISNQVRYVDSHNVVARLPGSDPSLAAETVIYSAHWDHLGRDGALQGDQIYNGAVDNASGVAGLIEIAKAYKALPSAPKRSVLFLAVTAEEQGLLGSRYYARNPLYPLVKTPALINMDALNPWGPTKDLQVVGSGQTTLEDTLAEVLTRKGRNTVPDAHPEKGSYYRSDQFEFAKVGVPGLYACRGSVAIDRPEGWLEEQNKAYTRTDYHNVSDHVRADWNLDGAARDLQALFEVGYRVAEGRATAGWKEGSEFKAIREASLAGASR